MFPFGSPFPTKGALRGRRSMLFLVVRIATFVCYTIAAVYAARTRAQVSFSAARALATLCEDRKTRSSAPFRADKHTRMVEGVMETLSPTKDGFAHVGGCTAIKTHMLSVAVSALKRPDIFFNKDLPQLSPARRYLFCGPPGTGKTMIAKAVAADGGALFLNVTLSMVEDKYFGETPKILQAIFAVVRHKAHAVRPVVLMFDELDGMMRARREDEHASSYGLKTEMLRLLDTLEATDRVVLIGCTNHEQALDAAVRRRFGMVVAFGLPNPSERRDIVRRIVSDREGTVSDRTLEAILSRTEGMSGSGIAALYDQACARRVRRIVEEGMLSEDADVLDLERSIPSLDAEDFPPAGNPFAASSTFSCDQSREDALPIRSRHASEADDLDAEEGTPPSPVH